jgi:FMN phosphatase YigB (HAD superfamily)
VNRVVADLGLGALFDTICFVGPNGLRKPDRAYFLRAAAEIDVPPSQCIHIGDSYNADALGALQAGFRGIWLNKGATSAMADPARSRFADHTTPESPPIVQTLDDFLDWVQVYLDH